MCYCNITYIMCCYYAYYVLMEMEPKAFHNVVKDSNTES